ncbi:MAG: hypothetical protein APF76_05105 [Desulfitibacter sp. BRH_c19]|nr:MAG: hypothetical protein APF76_05105 [Desulfitibacter sp. BRH_c19]
MYIDVEKLKMEKLSTRHYDFSLNLPELMVGQEEKVSFEGPIKVAATVMFANKDILVEGEITAKAQITCHCCLEPFIFDIEAPFKERFVSSVEYNLLSEDEQQGEDMNWYKNGKIDLQPFIEQAVILAIPMRAVCKDSCLGLCPKCGCNLNLNKCECKEEIIDPRLAVLQQLLKN